MIVLDSSAVVEVLQRGPNAGTLITALRENEAVAPHLMDVEVVSVLRRFVRERRMSPADGADLLERLSSLPIERVSHDALLPRMWELRDNFSAYDAAYIALAELTGAVLYTFDTKLATGHRARMVVFRVPPDVS